MFKNCQRIKYFDLCHTSSSSVSITKDFDGSGCNPGSATTEAED